MQSMFSSPLAAAYRRQGLASQGIIGSIASRVLAPRVNQTQVKCRVTQVADRFHLMQNFRETVERQLGGYEVADPGF